MGLSEALNTLARVGVNARRSRPRDRFVQPTAKLGLRADVSNIAEVLDLLEQTS